ncbi:hypothetical protein ACLOJK_036265 [Asimina triloba]
MLNIWEVYCRLLFVANQANLLIRCPYLCEEDKTVRKRSTFGRIGEGSLNLGELMLNPACYRIFGFGILNPVHPGPLVLSRTWAYSALQLLLLLWCVVFGLPVQLSPITFCGNMDKIEKLLRTNMPFTTSTQGCIVLLR